MSDHPPSAPISVPPMDEHNRTLVSNVHPADWTNPEPPPVYQLVVIGGGTAGLVSAAIGAALGARVALVERHLLGGDCLNTGCVPSKALIRSARTVADAREAGRYGVQTGGVTTDFGAVMTRMRRLRGEISPHDSAARFKSLGIDVHLGEARFVAKDAIEVAGRRLRFRRAILATGGRAALPPVSGIDKVKLHTNETIFGLTERPGHLAILGAGPIGCELAQTFRRLGCEVTLMTDGRRIMPREEDDAAALVASALAREGVRIVLGAKTDSFSAGVRKRIDYRREGVSEWLEADEILIAIGRRPNLEGLDLEAAGIAYNRNGVKVNDALRTSNRRVYAAGDICSPYKFTHAADFMARTAVRNALFPILPAAKMSRLVIPWCTYTDPEIAHVGAYARELRDRGVEFDTLEVRLGEVDRALLDGEEEGFIKVHVGRNGQILGATLAARHAGEMIGALVLAMTRKLPITALGGVILPYPTQAEVIRKAADQWTRRKLTPFRRRLLTRLLDWMLPAGGRS